MGLSVPRSEVGQRVCRVRPDVPALDRTFDYLVPDAMAAAVRVGTIVRVPLAGRRVRGLGGRGRRRAGDRPRSGCCRLAKVVGAGPPAEVIDALRRGPRGDGPDRSPLLLRAASPPNAVRGLAGPTLVLARPRAGDQRRSCSRGRRPATGAISSPSASRPPGSTLVHRRRHEPARRAAQAARARRAPDARAARHANRTRTGPGRGPPPATGRCVVVGGRIAVWAPVPDLAAVVVLDEGDEALQEERTPTWNARDVAVERARRSRRDADARRRGADARGRGHRRAARSGPTGRSSATAGRSSRSSTRARSRPGTGLLTGPLATALHHAVDRGGRAVCVLNRKGRARLLTCVACNELARCERCGAFVEETEPGTLRCARLRARTTGHLPALPRHPAEGAAARRVPGARGPRRAAPARRGRRGRRVDRRCSRAARCSSAPRRCCTGSRPGPPVLLVAFLDFDQELLAPRYRAAEQALGLLARAARRVGPVTGGGRLLVQTRLPDHEVLEAARRADPTRRRRRPSDPGARSSGTRRSGARRGARRETRRGRARCSTACGRSTASTCSARPARRPGCRRSCSAPDVDVALRRAGRRGTGRRGPRAACGSRSTRSASDDLIGNTAGAARGA